MELPQNYLILTFTIILSFFNTIFVIGGENSIGKLSSKENPRYLSFISARMNHLTAINDIKQLKNSVKRHQLIVDLAKKTFNVLDESRKRFAGGGIQMDLPAEDPNAPYIVNYFENTAFFCDLLIFFPEVTARLLEANLLWRITLIDSIQDAILFNVSFVDENTHAQFEKAYKILSEGAVYSTEALKEKSNTEPKKPKRKPRLSSNEL